MRHWNACTSRRRPSSLPIAAFPSPELPRHKPLLVVPQEGGTLKERLERLLDLLPRYVNRAAQGVEDTASSIPTAARQLFSKDGPFGALQFWRENKSEIEDTGRTLKDTGESIIRDDEDGFRRAASRLNLDWLFKPRETESVTPPTSEPPPPETNIEQLIGNIAVFAADSLTPWDFDRHDLGLTFAHTWIDADALPAVGSDGRPPVVKLTSTIKPLEGEWKLTARSKLMEVGDGGVVFGKAGMYIAGDQPAYIGIEADRVWQIPRLSRTKAFVNVNYRSSRKPALDPIRTTAGLQHDFELLDGFVLTLRIGTNLMERDKFFVTPVPHGSYF